MKFFKILLLTICLFLAACDDTTTKVGIIIPLENKALQQIVAGFSDTLKKSSKTPVRIKVMNAQGDMNMQRAIIQQMRDQHYSMIVPIGTGASQMTYSMVTDQAVVALAADIPPPKTSKAQCKQVTLDDEISPRHLIDFIHTAYPKLTHLTLIHSASEKVFPEVKEAIEAGKKNGIIIKPLLVSSLPELVSASHAIPANTQGIVILKDILIVSGINSLVKIAHDKKIPLIALDESSVEEGADFAIGVYEREIGEQGATIAASILANDSFCEANLISMKKLHLFINKNSKLDKNVIEKAGAKLYYTPELIGPEA